MFGFLMDVTKICQIVSIWLGTMLPTSFLRSKSFPLVLSEYCTTGYCPLASMVSCGSALVNMSSTAVGSTATYQCRDGPTDVYTTQCTSTGDWDPLPLSTLDCTSEESGSLCLFMPHFA